MDIGAPECQAYAPDEEVASDLWYFFLICFFIWIRPADD